MHSRTASLPLLFSVFPCAQQPAATQAWSRCSKGRAVSLLPFVLRPPLRSRPPRAQSRDRLRAALWGRAVVLVLLGATRGMGMWENVVWVVPGATEECAFYASSLGTSHPPGLRKQPGGRGGPTRGTGLQFSAGEELQFPTGPIVPGSWGGGGWVVQLSRLLWEL